MDTSIAPDGWWSDLIASIDAKDADRFVEFLDANAEFRFGSGPPIRGVPAIREAVAGFFGSIAQSRHRLIRIWSDDATEVCQGQVTYKRHDQSEITLPFVNVFEMHGKKIARYLIYIDIGPLYVSATGV